MLNSNYFNKRFIYTLEGSEYKALVEPNYGRREVYVFLPSGEKEGDYNIYLRKLDKNPLDKTRISSLSDTLQSHGFTGKDFINPFNRTKKIVQVLDVINELEKRASKTKVKK